MAGGTNADERFASVEMRSNRVELLFGWRAASHTHEEQIRSRHGLGQAREYVFVVRVCMDDSHREAAWFQLLLRKRGQRDFSLVLILANYKQDRAPIIL